MLCNNMLIVAHLTSVRYITLLSKRNTQMRSMNLNDMKRDTTPDALKIPGGPGLLEIDVQKLIFMTQTTSSRSLTPLHDTLLSGEAKSTLGTRHTI
jgi:hypothetical protein